MSAGSAVWSGAARGLDWQIRYSEAAVRGRGSMASARSGSGWQRSRWAMLAASPAAAAAAEHDLLHALPRLRAALVHADPEAGPGPDLHEVLASHR
jgi:hypothetical protein